MNFGFYASCEDIKKERRKAQQLKRTQWWKQKLSEKKCYYCNKEAKLSQELCIDHIVPLIRGGKSQKNNIVVSCKDCNNKKKYFLPFELNSIS